MKKKNKTERILEIYTDLLEGRTVSRTMMAGKYHVDERSISRDIEDIKDFLHNRLTVTGDAGQVIYDRRAGGYKFVKNFPLGK